MKIWKIGGIAMAETETKTKNETKSEWFDWIKALLVAGILAFLVRMFLFTPIVVDGPSMLPTLEDGDHLIVNKFSYTIGEPERFDIVVFHASENKDYIKRVVGTPGEHVRVENDVLFIDGERVEESFIEESKQIAENNGQVYTFDFSIEDLPGGYQTVPEGHVLVLGDNRSNSTDSRMLGMVPIDQLVGKAEILYWPLDRFRLIRE